MYKKNIYKFCLAAFAMGIIQVGCNKVESTPPEAKNEELIYDNGDINGFYVDQVLTNLYTFLPKGFNRLDNSFLDAATDDAVTSQLSSNIEIFSKGIQSPTQLLDDAFGDNYTGIYRANLLLSKIDVVPVTDLIKQTDKAEARFLRAMFYFELVKRYGGVPLLGDRVLKLSDDLKLPRNTYDECVQYIVSECDAISGSLRKEPLAANFVGHATQGAALALKARTLLYAASPLNNINNDTQKWGKAADAAKAVIDLNYYALNPNFVAAFNNRADKEVILAFQLAKNQVLEKADSPVGYTNDLFTSSGQTSPTQELVDAFPTINGKSISTDIKSDANPDGYDAANPYVSRDPRFSATIFYNGQQWLSRAVEIFEGGKDKPGGALVQTKTGYYLRKFLPNLSTATAYSAADHNFIIFRYAEILLEYAEALNEAGGTANTTLAYTQLKALRKRAGINPGDDALYGLSPNMTQSQMREAIRLERRIELAFEEHRFWDERRWKTAEVDFNKTLHGVTITKTAAGTFTYQQKNVGPITFIAPKMYRYPIAYTELQNNKQLTQNPGW